MITHSIYFCGEIRKKYFMVPPLTWRCEHCGVSGTVGLVGLLTWAAFSSANCGKCFALDPVLNPL